MTHKSYTKYEIRNSLLSLDFDQLDFFDMNYSRILGPILVILFSPKFLAMKLGLKCQNQATLSLLSLEYIYVSP